jgi:hypothetical protein
MKLVIKYRIIILLSILLLGFLLRFNNLYTWPRTGATFDEYAWTWLGISLFQNHIPESWSRHPQYTRYKNIIYQKTDFILVKPYLEHPPLFGLVAGGYAILNGVWDYYHVDISHIRGLAIILGILSILLMYLLVNEIYSQSIALLAASLYTIIPTIVVGSRIVENENFFIPLYLLVLLLIAKHIKSDRQIYRNIAAVVCGLLSLAKVPWVAATLAVVLILLYLKKYVDIFKVLIIVIPIFSLYFIYGFLLDANLFIKLWQLQLHRYDIVFNSIFALFTSPYLVDRLLIDGWIYFGWFAFILLLIKKINKNYIIIFALLSYLAIYLIAIPNEPGHGWYRYPFYPFLTISIAIFIKDYFNKNAILTAAFLLLVGLSLLQLSWQQVFGFSFWVYRLLIIFYCLPILSLFIKNIRTQRLLSLATYLSLISIFLLSIWTVLQYNEQ